MELDEIIKPSLADPAPIEEKMARIQFISNYIGDLRQQTGFYIGYIPNAYADQPSADNFYETIRKDTEIVRCSHLMSLMAAGERVKIKHENPSLVRLISKLLRSIPDFLHVRKSLIEKGMVFGLGIQKKEYRKVKWVDYPYFEWDVPSRIIEVDRRRLRIERDQDDRNRQYWTIWTPRYDQYQMIEDRNENPSAPLAIQDFIWYIHSYEEMSPYFEGFGDTLYMLAYMKAKALQYWSDLCESWSKPFLVGKIDLMKAVYDAVAGNGMNSAADRKEKLITEFEKWRARHVAIVDKSDELTWNEHGSAGSNIIKELVDFCDSRIQLLFFGSELSTGAGDGKGSYALGAVHKSATDTVVHYNRSRLCEVLQSDLIYDFLWRNRKNLELIGIEMPDVCDVQVEITVDSEELEKMVQEQNPGARDQHIPGGMQ